MQSLLILALTLLIPQLSFCAPLGYRRDDGGCGVRNCEQILGAISHLKGQIEEDPTGATKSWDTGNNDDKKQKQQQEQQQQEAEQQQQQQQEAEQQPEYTGGTESDNPACDATKPGQQDIVARRIGMRRDKAVEASQQAEEERYKLIDCTVFALRMCAKTRLYLGVAGDFSSCS